MRQYLYRLKLHERLNSDAAWTPEDEVIVGRHFARLQELAEEGTVLLAGKTDREYADGFGIVIIQTETREAAEQLMKTDPAVAEGIMSAVLYEYRIALESLSRGNAVESDS